MITYQYKCKSCGHELTARQKIVDDPLTHCPECNESELKRVIQVNAAGVEFKGSHWSQPIIP